jgi:hypothetical protein
MADDETLDEAARKGAELEEGSGPGVPRRLKTALSCSAVAGLVLVGDFVRQADARAELAAAAKKAKHQRSPRHTNWVPLVPWVISLLSVVALIIVIVAAR